MKRLPPHLRDIARASSPPETRGLICGVKKLTKKAGHDDVERLVHEHVASTKLDVWSWGYCVFCLLKRKTWVGGSPWSRSTLSSGMTVERAETEYLILKS
jgi:hypothetical protein